MEKFTTIARAKKLTGLSYLGGVSKSAKIMHSQLYSHQYTYAIYLAPSNLSGYNVCSHATKECKLGCLNTSGRAGIEEFSGKTMIHDCRVKKTKLFFQHPDFFMQWLIAEIKFYQRKAIKDGFFFSVRLNATSDLNWASIYFEGKTIFNIFPEVAFYDYTKNHLKFIDKPLNYHLTYSFTGRNEELAKDLLSQGNNVAVVFKVKHESELPTQFLGYKVINGDLTDARFLDLSPCIVGLKWKRIANRINEAKILNSCFVVNPNDIRCNTNVQKEVNELVLI
jgi:hypothetical protein